MTAPTPTSDELEQLQEFVIEALPLESRNAELRRALLRVHALLRAYPLPAAEGERAELAAEVLVAADWKEEAYRRAGEALGLVARARGAELCANLRRAAALLRAYAAIRGHWIDTATWACGDCGYATAREHDLCSKCFRPNRPPMIRERVPAVAGVSREAVLDLVERGRLHGSHGMISQVAADQACDELLAAVRALPEAGKETS